MFAPKQKVVALISCRNGIQHHALLFQVTLDPERVWPGEEFIRFGYWGDGKGQADELTGWMRLSEWELVEVMGKVAEDGKTVIAFAEEETKAFWLSHTVGAANDVR